MMPSLKIKINMLKRRFITKKLQEMSKVFSVIAITGARQVGKTTLLHELFGTDFDYVVFDPLLDIENARTEPDFFLRNHSTPLILDEVEYVPEIVSALKRKVDSNKKTGQYFLTGSQQWGIMKSMKESLAGRAVFLDLDGFSLCEIGGIDRYMPWLPLWLESTVKLGKVSYNLLEEKNTLEQIWRGWFPKAQEIPLEMIPVFYQSYHRTWIERDVRSIAEVSDWQLFGRFVQLASALTAQEINFSELGRELGVTPQTSSRWLELLKGAFQWFEIPAFSINHLKKISNKAKGYFVDSGLICTLQAISAPHILGGHPLWGPIFETAVISEIKKQANTLASLPNFYHWRVHSGAQVDLILEWNGRYYPIEIKGTSNPSKADARGIQAFRAAYPRLDIAEGLVICTCSKIQPLTEKDFAVPWNMAIDNPRVN